MEILDKERAISEDEKLEATNDKERAYNSGEIQCTKRVWHRVVKIPSVDAVPVVRCRECRLRCTCNCPMYHTENCFDDLDGFDDYNVDRTDDNGFCHRGEKNGR